MDYEPTESTTSRCETDIPTKGTVESLRAMPMDNVMEEFGENHSFESFDVKESKVSLIPRAPLTQINYGVVSCHFCAICLAPLYAYSSCILLLVSYKGVATDARGLHYLLLVKVVIGS